MSHSKDKGKHKDEESSKHKEESSKHKEEDESHAEDRIAELKETLQRVQAEFENYKKRQERDAATTFMMANAKLIKELLPIVDSLAASASTTGDKGMQALYDQFMGTLRTEGLEEMPCIGKEFDPYLHEALQVEEKDDVQDAEDGRITEEYQKGFLFKGAVLRHARVKVIKIIKKKIPTEGKADKNPANPTERE
ncbi:MAG: nucleotide exchange factor GrpE [archaeon]